MTNSRFHRILTSGVVFAIYGCGRLFGVNDEAFLRDGGVTGTEITPDASINGDPSAGAEPDASAAGTRAASAGGAGGSAAGGFGAGGSDDPSAGAGGVAGASNSNPQQCSSNSDSNTPAHVLTGIDGQPTAIAVDDDGYVYFSDQDEHALWRVAKNGSPGPELLHKVDGVLFPTLALDEKYIFFARAAGFETGRAGVYRIDKTASLAPELLTGELFSVGELAQAGNYIFFIATREPGGRTHLIKVPRGGGTAIDVYPPLHGPMVRNQFIGVAGDSTHVYVTDQAYGGTILRFHIDLEITNGDLISETFEAPSPIAVDASNVYWADSQGMYFRDKNMRLPKTNLTAIANILSISADDRHAYFAATNSTDACGSLYRLDVADPEQRVELLASGYSNLRRVTQDRDAVYFTSAGDGIIGKLAK